MFREMKLVVMALFATGAVMAMGCGGSEAEPTLEQTELSTQVSKSTSSEHCARCADYENICCQAHPGWAWSCGSASQCSVSCLSGGNVCLGNTCVDPSWSCELLK